MSGKYWEGHAQDCIRRMGTEYVCDCGLEPRPNGTMMTTAAVKRTHCNHGAYLGLDCDECNQPQAVGIDAMLTERGARYGKFQDHAEITQDLKAVMWNFEKDGKNPFHHMACDQRESLEMIQHKIGRILNGDPNFIDSWDDICGYAKLVADRLRGKSV